MLPADCLRFLRAAVRSPLHVGAIAPSSPAVARRMLQGLDFRSGAAVLELGPGTGPFTELLAQRLSDSQSYLGIERDADLFQLLSRRFPALRFVHGSAEQAQQYLRDSGHDRVQAVISGLPFASLPATTQDGILAALEQVMAPGAAFRAIQYLHSQLLPPAVRFRQRMSALFGPPEVSPPVFWNLPPAVVLSWTRPAA